MNQMHGQGKGTQRTNMYTTANNRDNQQVATHASRSDSATNFTQCRHTSIGYSHTAGEGCT